MTASLRALRERIAIVDATAGTRRRERGYREIAVAALKAMEDQAERQPDDSTSNRAELSQYRQASDPSPRIASTVGTTQIGLATTIPSDGAASVVSEIDECLATRDHPMDMHGQWSVTNACKLLQRARDEILRLQGKL